jgi:putative endonuclease
MGIDLPMSLRAGTGTNPGFPVEARGFDDLHAALFMESRTRGRRQQREVGNPGSNRVTMERMLALPVIERFIHVSDYLAVRLGRRSTSPAHLELGRRGEEAAFFYLRRRGYTVVARDWRSAKARGDLDLVAWENNTLCFIEVKTRSSRDVATAESAIDQNKTRVLRRMARQYLQALPVEPDQVRFDVMSIYYDAQEHAEMELYRDAFDWR